MDTTKLKSRLLSLLLAAGALLFLIAVPALHFHDRSYRQDEAWVVHHAVAQIEQIGLLSHIVKPLHELFPENVWQDIWVTLFGHHENITRFFSALVRMLALAMMYRLASKLFDRHSGWLAMILLGTTAIVYYYGHEARPYALMVFGSASFPWAWLRFIETPDLKRGALALMIAALVLFVHPFFAFLLASQLLCALAFVRWNVILYRRGAMLYGLIALVVAYRGFINYSAHNGEIAYNLESSWAGLEVLYDFFSFNPASLGALLVLGAFATLLAKLVRAWRRADFADEGAAAGLDARMRLPTLWREGWFALSVIAMLGAALLVNLFMPSLTPRNMLILAPGIALLAAISLRQIPRHLQLVVLIMLCLPFVREFRHFGGNAGYWELAAYMEERYETGSDRLVIAAKQMWEVIPINYYLQERTNLDLSPQDIFTLSGMKPIEDPQSPPAFEPRFTATGREADAAMRLRDFLGESERLWLIKGNPYREGEPIIAELEREYSLYSAMSFPGETYYRALEALEYRRQPPVLEPLWRFGKDIKLLNWRLMGGHTVQPCAQVTVESWWSTDVALDALYSSSLVMAGGDGNGIAHADDVPGGLYLTTIWQPDALYFDERVLNVPCDIAAGEYPLLLAMYKIPNEDQPLETLPIHSSGGQPTGQRYQYLTTLVAGP